jgi:uncharacterized protein (DUF885 family)
MDDARRALAKVAEDFWDFGLEESPFACTYLGLSRGADRVDERGPAARARQERALREFQRRVEAISPDGLEGEDRITRAVLVRQFAESLEGLSLHGWEWDLDQLMGFHLELQAVATKQPLAEPKDGEAFVARLSAAPRAFEAWTADLRAGLASGRTAPRVAYDRVLPQVKALAKTPTKESAFAKALDRAPATWSDADRRRVARLVAETVDGKVKPAYVAFASFLEGEYAGRSRAAPGVSSIPGGAADYAHRVRKHTTTTLSPERIHAIGEEELSKNEREMLEIARAEGWTGDLRSFLDSVGADPRFRLPSREALLDRYRSICARMDARLPEAFRRLPKRGYEVRALEEWREKDAPGAYYDPPDIGGTRLGIFYANTRDPKSWPTFDMEALSFHEAVPGHHLQIALAQELEGLPLVRRHGGFTAYVEGWAHYAERLADEMGAYTTPVDRLGMLAAQAWRAARLVVDTGLHALGWPRAKAVETMRRIRSGPESDVENEVDRYVVWPGQALAYKIGQRTFSDLRERARRRLGSRFSLAGFHDVALRHGALPLSILEDVVRTWEGDG